MFSNIHHAELIDTLWAIAAGLVVFLIVLLLSRRQRFSMNGTLGCGYCGYPVKGLDRTDCPECGAVFTVVGIFPAKGKRPHLPLIQFLIATASGAAVTTILLALWL